MKKINLQELIEKYPYQDLYDFYMSHNTHETMKYFGISQSKLQLLLNEYKIKKSKEQIQKQKEKTLIKNFGSLSNYRQDQVVKTKKTKLDRYGDSNYNNMAKNLQTKLDRYGNSKFNNREKFKSTILDTYTCLEDFYAETIGKTHQTLLDRYGEINPSKLDFVKRKKKDTLIDHYGSIENYKKEITKKCKETLQEKYGVENSFQLPQSIKRNKISKYNKNFASILEENNIAYIQEFPLENKRFDFKVDNYLIELNPTITHNSTFGIFNNSGMDNNYHINKTRLATSHGYQCIHIWDWDSIDIILDMLKSKKKIFARKCELREVSNKDCKIFLNENHLQGNCKNQKIIFGLYHDDELMEIMSFGPPRYNKNYQYELLRLCTRRGYIIVGGSEKLFNHFIKTYSPTSIISYCDNSKFNGNVYSRLGFSLKDFGKPSKHWFNIKSQEHITDNLLRQRGFDQLLGDKHGSFGKGTDNELLMLEHKFVEVYDSGQSVFIKKFN